MRRKFDYGRRKKKVSDTVNYFVLFVEKKNGGKKSKTKTSARETNERIVLRIERVQTTKIGRIKIPFVVHQPTSKAMQMAKWPIESLS